MHTISQEFENGSSLWRFLEFIRMSEDVVYRSGIRGEQGRSLERRNMRPTESIVEAETYIEHGRQPVGLSISRRPFIPCDGLTSFEDLFKVSKQPAWGRRSWEFPEWRLGAADFDFDEREDGCEERRRNKS